MNNKVVATIEARMTSSRLPGKVLMKSCGKPILQHIIERLRNSRRIDDIIVATTVNREDKPIIDLCESIQCLYYRGSEEDVLDRVVKTAQYAKAGVVVEITGDCPFVDWRHIDKLVSIYFDNKYDFVSNNIERSYPLGFDVRVFPVSNIDKLNKESTNPLDHEHVSIHFPNHPDKYKCYNLSAEGEENRPELEFTLDEIDDYYLIDRIFEGLYFDNKDFSCLDVIRYVDCHPEIMHLIRGIKRTEFCYDG